MDDGRASCTCLQLAARFRVLSSAQPNLYVGLARGKACMRISNKGLLRLDEIVN